MPEKDLKKYSLIREQKMLISNGALGSTQTHNLSIRDELIQNKGH
jgi:hypothetical protein